MQQRNGTLLTVKQRVVICIIIRLSTKSIESNLCDYSDTYFLVTGDITVTGRTANSKVAFKNWAPFNKYRTEINGIFVDEADFIDIAMSTYNLTEYSDSDSDSWGSLCQIKRDEVAANANVCNANSSSFKLMKQMEKK